MSYQHITYEVEDGILVITLNRPDNMNAFTSIMRDELIDAYDRADEDDSVRAIIVTGAGRAFCAGADLGKGKETFDYDAQGVTAETKVHRDGGGQVTLRMFQCKKPIIGAINGAAVGIGATMTLPMDVRIASTQARIGFVFSRRGIVPEACSSWFLPRVVGISQALEWVYSGRVFPASEAKEGGLVKSLHEPEDLMVAARELARSFISETSAVSVALSRQMMWRMLGADHPMEAHKVDSRGIYHMGQSPDVKEGVTAFLEKRPARFTMKPSSDMPPYYPWWQEPEFE
ncbi:crotonase/enoyl-CoA hydratase family protein [Sneathiella chinensis]|uniref:Enoyl-CoA hydratase n=1 Tax=Sneathiella chinensis TaxID=349750 RepID=A0ABQ5U8B2_9PROT|nr:crotonase/enoyl-CoA hydratase family protein [Sneathiella chinensis]GLQ07918.1 enoyl-CoA hydratase [Sneathiella chinensis]